METKTVTATHRVPFNPVFRAADEIEWHGARYRVASVRRWDAFGYCQAVAVRAGVERSENG